jgi:hypothetical protein
MRAVIHARWRTPTQAPFPPKPEVNLAVATAFFVELGLKLAGEVPVEGRNQLVEVAEEIG